MAVYTTIDDPEAYFQTALHAGTGSELAVTLPGDTDMQPNLTWIKNRSSDYSHRLYDSVRGATKLLYPDLADVEGTDAQGVKSWQSDGFTVGTDGGINENTSAIVSWNWKESATAGFDIVTYTGNDTARTISHSLSAVPHFMIVRNRSEVSGDGAWQVYHGANTAAPETDNLQLAISNPTEDSAVIWNDTAPTSSVFSVGSHLTVNGDGNAMLAYLWSEKQGFRRLENKRYSKRTSSTFRCSILC